MVCVEGQCADAQLSSQLWNMRQASVRQPELHSRTPRTRKVRVGKIAEDKRTPWSSAGPGFDC